MKLPTRTPKKTAQRRLSPAEWIAAEELYRNGWTQGQIADKYGIRAESVSRHMTKKGVKGGERADMVREELAAALTKKQREFAESKASRQIDAKEMLYKMNNALLGTFAKEFKTALETGKGLGSMQGIAKAMKDSVHALKLSREEVYVILDINDASDGAELPELKVTSMTLEDEAALRAAAAGDDDDDLVDPEAEIADVVQKVEHDLQAQGTVNG